MPRVLFKDLYANGFYEISSLDEYLESHFADENFCDMSFDKLRIIDYPEENCKLVMASFPEDDSVYAGYIQLRLQETGLISGSAHFEAKSNWRSNIVKGQYIIYNQTLYLFLDWEPANSSFNRICLEIPVPDTRILPQGLKANDPKERQKESNSNHSTIESETTQIEHSLLELLNKKYPTAIRDRKSHDFICRWYHENNNHLLVLLPHENQEIFNYKCIGHHNIIELYLKNPYVQKFYSKGINEKNYCELRPLLMMIYSMVESAKTLPSYHRYISQYIAMMNHHLNSVL